MVEKKKDDLETVRLLAEALEPFSEEERKRIIRWSLERLGMPNIQTVPSGAGVEDKAVQTSVGTGYVVSDIKSFVGKKIPKNDNQFCAVVAYFYQFEAPENQKKDSIGGKDLQDTARKVGRSRFTNPAQTLINSYNAGYLDKIKYGEYRINTVGENLVAMVLPGGGDDNTLKKSGLKKPVKRIKKKTDKK